MTLSAAKVVVAEQMKLQSSNTSRLSVSFRKEIEQIQNEFPDKSYWKVMQPKIYLNRMNHSESCDWSLRDWFMVISIVSCFVCHDNIDDVENHFLSSHQIPLMTMNMMKQCCICGFHCKKKDASLFEHQLRVHAGICYSLVLKQFIRFEPAPPAISTPSPSTSSRPVTLSTYTEKVKRHSSKENWASFKRCFYVEIRLSKMRLQSSIIHIRWTSRTFTFTSSFKCQIASSLYLLFKNISKRKRIQWTLFGTFAWWKSIDSASTLCCPMNVCISSSQNLHYEFVVFLRRTHTVEHRFWISMKISFFASFPCCFFTCYSCCSTKKKWLLTTYLFFSWRIKWRRRVVTSDWHGELFCRSLWIIL